MRRPALTCYNNTVTVEWARSRYCTGGNCVEAAPTPTGVLLRDSKNPAEEPHEFETYAWADFLTAVRAGEFDPW